MMLKTFEWSTSVTNTLLMTILQSNKAAPLVRLQPKKAEVSQLDVALKTTCPLEAFRSDDVPILTQIGYARAQVPSFFVTFFPLSSLPPSLLSYLAANPPSLLWSYALAQLAKRTS
ncbi:hypothetical protein MUK42_18938 [Musa troglodytarum]|uniref:Uncharacterized protein n=1 Tax=Musa troglodytarum TaxID=320322 RepID=A0A9E7F8T9_9LILI|nr:hypothetical protein MUK42_18938 [Musa troglodytarum]